jgi:hypothetical protein
MWRGFAAAESGVLWLRALTPLRVHALQER